MEETMTTKKEIEYLICHAQAVARNGHKTLQQAKNDGAWPESARRGLNAIANANALYAAKARMSLIGLLAEQ